ncbi:MAG: protein kinase [Kiritimatiellaeota bacterium]|nr:protein kinase [Kiritimatiellota bacterium]
MRFQCSHCLGVLAIEDAEAGEPVACGYCGSVVLVPATRLSPHSVVGDFVIQAPIGRGEMGTVFLAHQLSLDRPVAFRALHDRFCDDPEYLAEFARTAHSAALLNHPNIVQVYASGEEDGVHFMAVELVRGRTLGQVLEHSGSIVPDRVLEIAAAVAAALDFAWSNRELVHGAVRPVNIVLHEQGHAGLVDFGLARPALDWLTTSDESVQGAPQYMAPEQIIGGRPDPAGDLYGLGAALYHAVTGRPPYSGPTTRVTVEKHLTEPLTPPREVAPGLPPALATVIEALLAKRPPHRYASAAELLADLHRVRQGEAPVKEVHPDAQAPLALPGKSAAAARASGTRRRLRRTSAAEPTASDAGVAETGAPPPPGVEHLEADEAPEVSAASKRTGLRLAVVLLFVLLAAGIGFGLWFLRRSPERPGATAAGRARSSRARAQAAKAQGPAAEIRSLLARHAAPKEVLARLAAFERDYPDSGETAAALRREAADVIEQEVREQRARRHEAELAEWQKRATLLREQARKAAEERVRREQAAAEERRRRREEERRAALREKKARELAKARENLRWKAVELCRKHRFADARALFVPLVEADDPETRAWAKAKQTCIDLAEKAFKLVAGSGNKLKGERLAVPKRTGKGRIDYISTDDISIVFAQKVFNDKGEELGERIVDRVHLPLTDVPEAVFWELCRTAWEKDHDDPADLLEMFGAYLLSRGRYLADARRNLIQSGKPEATAPLIEELDVMAGELRRQEWNAHWKRVVLLRRNGNMKGVRQYLDWLKLHYPKEYEEHARDIRETLQDQ